MSVALDIRRSAGMPPSGLIAQRLWLLLLAEPDLSLFRAFSDVLFSITLPVWLPIGPASASLALSRTSFSFILGSTWLVRRDMWPDPKFERELGPRVSFSSSSVPFVPCGEVPVGEVL